MKRFNTAGTCFPTEHYMVDIHERVQEIASMVERGDYFCINRGRQYGKTTTLSALRDYLMDEYIVFSISFEGMGNKDFEEANFYKYFLGALNEEAELMEDIIPSEISKILREISTVESLDETATRTVIYKMCKLADKPVVIIIDEVDQSSNHEVFIKFLGMLRKMYLNRHRRTTFKSVILASVFDVKNLKLKLRPDIEHEYNSPWNIAVPFDIDMSLSESGIDGMLLEYKKDHGLDFDTSAIAKLIREYTSGYPFLVSRICQIIDTQKLSWNKGGFLTAVNVLLNEQNTLFDDLYKKLTDFPLLKEMLKDILYHGNKKSFNYGIKEIELASKFGYVYNNNNAVVIANRIFETLLYNKFIAEEESNSSMYNEGSIDKQSFINNGMLDMKHVLERFAVHYNEIYSDKDIKFLEEMGRKLFLLYLRPIINGVGHYYVEAQTRDETRMDIVVDYLGKRYIIEMKIWRGAVYNEAGKKQLVDYLKAMNEDTGYLISFCFNKNKDIGVNTEKLDGKTIVEAIV